jgi:ABC-type nitrate/sulfonate/bicarbonate transport system substrate-binding protein
MNVRSQVFTRLERFGQRRKTASSALGVLALGLLVVLAACGQSPPAGAPAAPAPGSVSPGSGTTSATGAGGSAAPPPRQKVVVGYSQRSVSQGMHIYGMEAGYFDQQGLDVEFTQIPGASVLAAAMIAGEVQVGTVGASAPVEARLGGADLVMIADTTPIMVFWVVGRPEVRSVADLSGKRVGVTRIGTATHFGGRLALRHHGLDPERDVVWLNMSTNEAVLAGLEAGSLDAGVVTPVEKLIGQRLGLNALFDIGTISPPFSQAGLVISQKLGRERPDLVLRYLRGHLDGLKRLRAEPDWGKQVMAQWLDTTDQSIIEDSYQTYVRRALPEIPAPRTESVVPIIELIGQTDQRVNQLRAEDVIEPKFMQQLEAEGFFQQPPGSPR